MSYLSKILSVLITVNLTLAPVLALELDLSVDEEIRKNYNPSKLELESLPPLPNVTPVAPANNQPFTHVEVSKPANNLPELLPSGQKPLVSKVDKTTSIRIKKGTKFKVRSNQTVSDATSPGTRLSFTSQKTVTQTYVTIPQGTVFKGEVANAHLPQYSGNGGLIVLAIDSMIFRGSTIGIDAKITKTNHKKIFLNNIKGKRQYWQGTKDSLQPGTRFYRKMMKTTSNLANGTFTIILTPFTVAAGMVVYGVNFVGAPLFGLCSKGDRITIPAGTEFEIKLLDDVYLY